MRRPLFRLVLTLAFASLLLVTAGTAQTLRTQPQPQPQPKQQPKKDDSLPRRDGPFTPKFEALAETKLLMEGLANSNYRGLHKLLKDKPADNETWAFVRGQALLMAETGNLLLLRPPRNNGRDTWMKLAMTMRDEAGELARKAAARNHAQSKVQFQNLTNACNKCHQTFRVNVKVAPEADLKEPDAE